MRRIKNGRLLALWNYHTIVGMIALVVFSAIYFIIFIGGEKTGSTPGLNLVEVRGVVAGISNEKGHKGDGDLLIELRGSEVRYRSDNPYPSKFRSGSKTPDVVKVGTVVVLDVEKDETLRKPRMHRIRGYLWREFVGLEADGIVHLAPADHYAWHEENRRVGSWLIPGMALLGLIAVIGGYRKRLKELMNPGTKFSPALGKQIKTLHSKSSWYSDTVGNVDFLRLVHGRFGDRPRQKLAGTFVSFLFLLPIPALFIWVLSSEPVPFEHWGGDQWILALLAPASVLFATFCFYHIGGEFEFNGTSIILRRRGIESNQIAIDEITSAEFREDRYDNRFLTISSERKKMTILIDPELDAEMARAKREVESWTIDLGG